MPEPRHLPLTAVGLFYALMWVLAVMAIASFIAAAAAPGLFSPTDPVTSDTNAIGDYVSESIGRAFRGLGAVFAGGAVASLIGAVVVQHGATTEEAPKPAEADRPTED